MRAVEFESEISNNSINIPESLRLELSSKDQHVRVIMLIDDVEKDEEAEFRNIAALQFLNGYDETDSVYDNL